MSMILVIYLIGTMMMMMMGNVNGFASTMEDDNDDTFEFNPSKPVTNGYMSIQPIVKECF